MYDSVRAAFRGALSLQPHRSHHLLSSCARFIRSMAEYPPKLPATQLTPTLHLPLHSSLFPAITTLSLVSKENKDFKPSFIYN
jgi:hypothetical protein